MKTTVFAGLLLASTLAAGTAFAQPAPFNEVGVTMGHWHIASKDVEANKKIFVAMGGKLFMPGGTELMHVPRHLINLNLGTRAGRRRLAGFGGQPRRLHRQQRPGAGREVEGRRRCRCCRAATTGWTRPSSRRRTACASKSWKTRRNRCRSAMSTSTCSVPEGDIPKAQAWYAKTFGGKAGTRNNAPVVDFPASRSASPRPTRHRLRPRGACSTTSAST